MLSARQALASDLPVVEAITRAAYDPYVPELGGPPVPLTEEYGPRIAAGGVWLISRGGEELGLAVLEPPTDHLAIFSLAVRPEAHGGGIGRWMLAFAEERARALGLKEVRLYTHPRMTRNILVYGRAGYVETGRHPNPLRPGWTAVHMAKRLT